MQVEDPAAEAKKPAGQFLQKVEPWVGAKVPTGQSVQVVAAGAELSPMRHCVQVGEPVAGAWKPGWQGEQMLLPGTGWL